MCTPNPCEHSGICNVTGPSSYTCDCNGTRYTGINCEIGIIETPVCPPLIHLQPKMFTLYANPDFELTVRLRSGVGLFVNPNTIHFSPTRTSANIFITGAMAGVFTISYEIGGKSSSQFQQPEPSTLIVQQTNPISPSYFTSRGLEPGMLESGSCEYATPLDYICPNENDQISFSSTCRWHGNVSPGLIFSTYRDLNLPVAISGARISGVSTADQSRVIPLTGNDFQQQCNYRFPSTRQSCNFKPSRANLVQEIQNFLRTEALGHTFLSQAGQLIPNWLQFSVNTNTPRTHDSTSYMIDLVESDSLSEIEGCSNLFTVKDGMYSVLKYSGSLNFSVNSSLRIFTPQGSPVCFAVNLCEGLNSPLLISIPDEAQNIVNSLLFVQILRNYGWEFTINSIAISSTSFSHELSGSNGDYWFGNQEVTYSFLDSTIIVKGRFTHSFSLGTLQIDYSLDGQTYLLYDQFDMVGNHCRNVH